MGEWEKQVNQLRDDLTRLQARNRELERQLADALQGKVPEAQETDADMISAGSMVSSKTGEPRVVIRWATMLAQPSIPEAQQLAFQILEACEAARSDAFLVNFFREKLGMKEDVEWGRILLDFREWREAQEKKEAT